jgi:AraC-like DNA-binding protein
VTSTAANSGTLRISTTNLPARDRLAAWREDFGRKVLRLDFEPLRDVPFHVEMTLRALPALDMMSVRSSPMRVLRTKELVADGDDGFSLGFASAGGAIVSGRGRELTLNDNDTVLASWAESATFVHPVPLRFISLQMSRAALTSLVRNVDDAVMRLIPRNIQALRLLTSYLNVLGEDQTTLATPELRRLVVSHVYDLVALTIGATQDAAALAQGRGVRAARLRAIKADVAENVGRCDLSVTPVAARHRVTPRYVQKLFETEGTTFSQFVLAQRVVRAHRMLTDPRFTEWKISAIAFEAGFTDLSYFNRAFRQRYAASPSDMREAACREHHG